LAGGKGGRSPLGLLQEINVNLKVVSIGMNFQNLRVSMAPRHAAIHCSGIWKQQTSPLSGGDETLYISPLLTL